MHHSNSDNTAFDDFRYQLDNDIRKHFNSELFHLITDLALFRNQLKVWDLSHNIFILLLMGRHKEFTYYYLKIRCTQNFYKNYNIVYRIKD